LSSYFVKNEAMIMHTGRTVRSHAAVNYILINVNDKHYAAGKSTLTKQPLIHAETSSMHGAPTGTWTRQQHGRQ